VRVTGFLIEKDGSAASADRETVERLLEKGELLGFDLYRPDAGELGMLATVFGIHQLALEDAEQFGQRPKLEDYDDFTQLVAYGVNEGSDDLVEVHFFYSTRYLVTVRHSDCTAFAEVRKRLAHRAKPVGRLQLMHHILDELTDGFFPVLSSFDGSMDAYLSTVSNRLNVIMKQLTLIATIFLPLSFLTGFFGQNFGWMIQRIGSLGAFLVVGPGTELVVVGSMLAVFRRRGWL
jgi:Mg2+ and Co2+ transporter CorA